VISIVIPAHNEEALIGRAIRSVVDSTSIDFEVVVVLDRCTDGTGSVVAGFRRDSIRTVENQGPPGLAGARNTALGAARGEWIACLDADDIQHPGRLERQLALADRESLDICCAWARLVDDRGSEIRIQATPLTSDGIAKGLRRSNVIVQSTVLMKRLRVLGYGGYRKTRWEDYDLWVRLTAAGFRFGCLGEVVVTRQLRSTGYGERQGQSLGGRIDVARLRLRAMRRNRHLLR
jgi:glycosyltransferase involved in cell wall biosynthesis